MNLKKVEEGRYRTDDGQFEVVEVDGEYQANVVVEGNWVTVATESTKAKAEAALTKADKAQD